MPHTWSTGQLAKEATDQGKEVSGAWIRYLCQTGRIKAEKPATDWLIDDTEAQRWLDEWLKDK